MADSFLGFSGAAGVEDIACRKTPSDEPERLIRVVLGKLPTIASPHMLQLHVCSLSCSAVLHADAATAFIESIAATVAPVMALHHSGRKNATWNNAYNQHTKTRGNHSISPKPNTLHGLKLRPRCREVVKSPARTPSRRRPVISSSAWCYLGDFGVTKRATVKALGRIPSKDDHCGLAIRAIRDTRIGFRLLSESPVETRKF